MQKGFGFIGILIVVAAIAIAGAAWYTRDSWKPDTAGLEDDVVAGICPQDAMQCPDGSYVSRTGPNCEFAECPTSKVGQDQKDMEIRDVEVDDRYNIDTSSWKTYRNEKYGFEVKYPDGWLYRELKDTGDGHGFALDFSGKVILSIFPGALDQVVEETTKSGVDRPRLPTEHVVINGIEMTKVFADEGYETNYRLYFKRNDLIFAFSEGFGGRSGDKIKIEKMHSTFKFIN